MNRKNKKSIILLLVLPWAAAVIAFFFYYVPPFEPSPNAGFTYVPYNDTIKQGHSKVHRFEFTDDGLILQYQKEMGFDFAYAGLNIYPHEKKHFIDLSSYDHFEVELKAEKGKRVPVILGIYIPGYSDSSNFNKARFMIYAIDIDPALSSYTIPLSKFKTPAWWYYNKNINQYTIGDPDFSKVQCISIQSCDILDIGIKDTYYIGKIKFYKNSIPFLRNASIFIGICYILIAVWFYIQVLKRREVKHIVVNYNPTQTSCNADKAQDKVLAFITGNYTNPELSLKIVQKETGVQEGHISQLIRHQYNASFRQFLNHLRLTEAKRLLLQTDLQVSEIAYQVGYGNISHFNRVFKEYEQATPNDFRKRNIHG